MSNSYIAQLRAQFADEVAAHETEIAAMLLSEGNPLQTCEALFNRVCLMRANGHPSYSIMDMLVKSRFYGPINREGLPRLVRIVARSGMLKHMFAAIDAAMAGSDTIRGFTDQGLKSDPNGWRTPRIDMGGNVYNDWDGGGIGHVKAAAWREAFEAAANAAMTPIAGDYTTENLQVALNFFGALPLTVDGVCGPVTREAIKDFQRAHNLTPDGIAGPQTWACIDSLIKGP